MKYDFTLHDPFILVPRTEEECEGLFDDTEYCVEIDPEDEERIERYRELLKKFFEESDYFRVNYPALKGGASRASW